ncbi:TPR-like protein [Serendipita vermifera]|nr:TPR-like protein [Serendipita vermifera]
MQLRGGPGEPESREYLQSASAVAFYELEAGEHRKACERGEEVLKKQRELFGEQDIDTLITYSKLLRTYFYLGRTDDLIKQGYDVIQISQKFKNDPDNDTALDAKHAEYKAKSVMAEYFWTLERNEEAFEMMKDALALCVDLFGSEEPDSLWAASLLARCYSAKGDHATALKQQQEIVERCIRSLGPEHTVTINSKDNIAVFHAYLGNSEEALRISKEIVQARTKLLGDDHPDTLAAICDMATHVANAGDLKGALKIEERVLEDYRRTMGEDHPDCIRLIGRIANNYSLMGKPKEALSHGEEALRLSIQVLGQEHPHTKSLEEAVELYQTKATAHDEMDEDLALASCERALPGQQSVGPNHIDTLTTMSRLLKIYLSLGRYEQIETMAQSKIRDLCEESLSKVHPVTLYARKNLALFYSNVKEAQTAYSLSKDVVSTTREILGHSHPTTLSASMDMATYLGNTGDLNGAIKVEEDLVETCKRDLGEEHPDTIRLMSHLAGHYSELGQMDQALELGQKAFRLSTRFLAVNHPLRKKLQTQLRHYQSMVSILIHN